MLIIKWKKKIFMWLLSVDVVFSHGRVFVTLCPHFQDVVRTICSSPLGEVYYHTTISLYYILFFYIKYKIQYILFFQLNSRISNFLTHSNSVYSDYGRKQVKC